MNYQTTNLKKLEFLIYNEKTQKMNFFKKKFLGYQAIPKCSLNPKFEVSTTKTVAYSAWTDGRTDRQTDRIVKTEDLLDPDVSRLNSDSDHWRSNTYISDDHDHDGTNTTKTGISGLK